MWGPCTPSQEMQDSGHIMKPPGGLRQRAGKGPKNPRGVRAPELALREVRALGRPRGVDYEDLFDNWELIVTLKHFRHVNKNFVGS